MLDCKFALFLLICALLMPVSASIAAHTGAGEELINLSSLSESVVDLDLSFDFRDDDYDDDDDWRSSRRSRSGPRSRNDRVEFRYRDAGYDRVYIVGSFNDWDREPMKLDRDEEYWTIKKRITGYHRYQFIIKEDGDTWDAIDPSVDEMTKTKRHGWVSEIRIDKNRSSHYRSRDYGNWSFDEIVGWQGWEGGFYLDYQRADGLYPTITTRYGSHHEFDPAVKATVGYGFKSKEWGGSLSIVQAIAPENYLSFKVSGYSETAFTDQTGINTMENSQAFALFKEDFRDYYRREGASLSLIGSDFKWWRIESGVHLADYFSMDQVANWSIWGDNVRPNPEVGEGIMRSVFADLTLGNRFNNISVSYERSGEEIMKGDFEFEQITGQYRARLPLGYQRHIDFRVKGGTTLSGCLPPQRRYVLGGLGTVRGYNYQSILLVDDHEDDPKEGSMVSEPRGGEKMFLANVEHVMKLDDNFSLVLFADTGMAWYDQDQDVSVADLKSSAGIGFVLGGGNFRVNLIKRLDGSDKDAVAQVRISRMF